jgi:uncharacterized LabA/DUF88 family protein
VIIYIDGFNLFYGLKRAKWNHYYWLDIAALGMLILKPGQQLVKVKYFTSMLKGKNQDKRLRQLTYIEAISARPYVECIFGQYRADDEPCWNCHKPRGIPKEKQTDVNIAVHMLCDANENAFDCAILITRDSDQVPTIKAIRRLHAEKRIGLALPPPIAPASELRGTVHYSFRLTEEHFSKSQLADTTLSRDGHPLHKPDKWNK